MEGGRTVPELADELLGPASARPLANGMPVIDGRVLFTILGEPASKANSRKPAFIGKGDNRRMLWIKSDKARAYEKSARLQIPKVSPLLIGPVIVMIRIWYASERPDLDESLILDCLQDRIYANDRQVREKHIYHGIDRENPRAEVTVQTTVPQQAHLL